MRLGPLLTALAFIIDIAVSASLHDRPSSSSGSNPIVTLPYGSFQGKVLGTVAQFLGIPYAAPPTGKRRFAFPEPALPVIGIRNATEFGASCPQQAVQVPPDIPGPPPPSNTMSEDCLFVNVVRPANASCKKLPVLFFFYGGGFEVGDSSLYPGFALVNRSVALEEPIIFVTANYRANAFGFLAGKEVKEKGLTNVGLRDQRFALKWVQDNIAAFGGDPEKVTIWGQSAGGISVSLHLLLDEGNTNGLFSAAVMESGAPIRLPDIPHQQVYFDSLVSAANCTDAPDRFECLRYAPYSAIQSAVDATPSYFSYQSLSLVWVPVLDGTLIPQHPMQLVEAGKYAKVPFISGGVEDEGTEFSLFNLNITTNDQFLTYMNSNYLPFITADELQTLAKVYPEDVTQGSPFNTGTANAKTPQYKRLAAIQGDMFYQGPRRFFLEVASKTQPAYSYRYARASPSSVLGTFHGSDVAYFLGFGNQTDFIATDGLIYFASKHDPNPPAESISLLRQTNWPKWSSSAENPPMLSFFDPAPLVNITPDTYRSQAIEFIIQLIKKDR